MKSFSVGWFVGITLLNLLGTVLLGFMAFAAAWGAPHGGGQATAGLHWIEVILWVWTTGPMLASLFGLTGENGSLIMIALWALLLGTIAGFLMPKVIVRAKHRCFEDVDVPPDKW
jgi:hypothetical protein